MLTGLLSVSLLVAGAIAIRNATASPSHKLLWAIDKGDGATVGRLIHDDPSLVNALDPDDVYAMYPLEAAAMCKDQSIVKQLLRAGADPNSISGWGTPLLRATEERDESMVVLLLENGASPNDVPGGSSALAIALFNGDERMANVLRRFGARPTPEMAELLRSRRNQPPPHSSGR